MKKPLLNEMTLREKIGQMLLPYQYHVYCEGDGPDRYVRTEQEVKDYIGKEQFGSYWMEQVGLQKIQNPALKYENKRVSSGEYKPFIDKQDSFGKIPAFMALDAETEGAGYVFGDLSVTCNPLAVGATDSEELAYELGAQIAKELRCAGANWRWAPCVDIAHRYGLGSMRTFAPDDPDRIIKLARAHIKGVQDNGVAATAKHFPGGDRYDYRDAHFTCHILSSDMDEWWREQGKIFKGVIDDGVYSIMIGHQSFPAVDDSMLKGKYRPSTVSKKVVTGLLKGELGFKGVVVTDGIVMAALASCYESTEDLLTDLVNAGNDVLLGTYPGAGDIIEKAVKDGRIEESRIDDACQRVLDMKEKIGLFEDGYQDPGYTAKDVVPVTRELNRKIAEGAVTLVRDTQGVLPFDSSKIKNVTIVCSAHVDEFFDKLQYMKKLFEDRGMNVRLQRRVSGMVEMDEISENSDLIIYAAYVAPHQPKGHMGLYGDECETYHYAFSRGQEKSVGLSMGYPYLHYDIMGNAETFINAYGCAEELMEAFVKGIFGEIEIKGVSPVDIEPELPWF